MDHLIIFTTVITYNDNFDTHLELHNDTPYTH